MPSMCPLYGGCPYLGGSVMGGSTVYPRRQSKLSSSAGTCIDLYKE